MTLSVPTSALYHDPLVSVVMTTYESEAHVMRAVRSVLGQTWRNLELVVVDDASSDGTLEAVSRINDARVKLWHNRENAGTYFCKNFGIQQARGAFIAVHDADDYSDPTRIQRQVQYLRDNPGVQICKCQYVRVDANHKALGEPRPGFQAAMFRRGVFDDIGFFDTVRAAADDEFDQRARVFYGGMRTATVPELLCYSLQRGGSLTERYPIGGVERSAYVKSFEAWHASRGGADDLYVPFPHSPRRFDAHPRLLPDDVRVEDQRLRRVQTVGEKVTASMATLQSRRESFRRVVEDILPQVDHLRVYLNDYDEVPAWLRDEPRITTFLGHDHAGDIADNGKFYRVADLQGYHLAIDDDLHYPPDYAAVLKARIDAYAAAAVVGVHGIVIRYDRFESYYDARSREVSSYRRALHEDKVVHLLGTGTVAYHTAALAIDFVAFNQKFMADIFFAIQAHRKGVPLICVSHDGDWLGDYDVPRGASIYEVQRHGDQVQTRLVRDAALRRHPPHSVSTGGAASLPPTAPTPEGRRLERVLRSLQVRLHQSEETVRLLAAGVDERDASPQPDYVADLRYRPETLRLGPFGSQEDAESVVSELRDSCGLDSKIAPQPEPPSRYFVDAEGFRGDAASVALKDALASRYTRGERVVRLGPFSNSDVAKRSLTVLSERIDSAGRFIHGFAISRSADGTWVEVRIALRPGHLEGVRRPESHRVLPWTDEEVRVERCRLLDDARQSVRAGRYGRALRAYAFAREIDALEPEHLHGMGLCLTQVNHIAAGVEALVEAAAQAQEAGEIADTLRAVLDARPARHRTPTWEDLVARRPDVLRFRLELADALLASGEPALAVAVFGGSVPPVDPLVWELAGYQVARKAGRPGRAMAFLARATSLRLRRWAGLPAAPRVSLGRPAEATRREPRPRASTRLGGAGGERSSEILSALGLAQLAALIGEEDGLDLSFKAMPPAKPNAPSPTEAGAPSHAGLEATREALVRARSDLEVAEALRRAAQHQHGPAVSSASPEGLAKLKMACILDEFSHASYGPECNVLQLSPQHWEQELESFEPELLFVESAWRGKDDLWGNKVARRSQQLVDIVAWSSERGVPTVFWNKEDPVHFQTFLDTAKLFDYVFTTDIDCIHRYKRALGHDRVYLLPFACQPRTTHPLETYERKDAFCFAGAYYVRYPERARDLEHLVEALSNVRPVEIYDRNHGKDDPNYQFPPLYRPFIVGHLPFDQIDRAYKGYRYAINLNSIKHSQSMFARRVFELLASNTITVSNFSRGVRLFFGDLVVTTDSGSEAVRRLEALASNDVAARHFRLAGLRKVMREHTYQDRLAYVVAKVHDKAPPDLLPRVVVAGLAADPDQLRALVERFKAQSYSAKRLLVVVPDGFPGADLPTDETVRIHFASTLGSTSIGELLDDDEWIAAITTADHHGPCYLLDLALASRYSTARAFGKVAHYVWLESTDGLALEGDGGQYRAASWVPARAALVHHDVVEDLSLCELLTTLDTRRIEVDQALGIDEFNYCKDGGTLGSQPALRAVVEDLAGLDVGLGIDVFLERAEQIDAGVGAPEDVPVFTGSALAGYFRAPSNPAIRCRVDGKSWVIESSLADGESAFLDAAADLRSEELDVSEHARFYLDAMPGLDLRLVVVFLDSRKVLLGRVAGRAHRNQEAKVPAGTRWIRLGLHVQGGGLARVDALVFGRWPMWGMEILPRGDLVVVTDAYPSYGAPDRGAPIHERVRAHLEQGIRVEVFQVRIGAAPSYREFCDVDVISGSPESLGRLLATGGHRNVLVHSVDESLVPSLRQQVELVEPAPRFAELPVTMSDYRARSTSAAVPKILVFTNLGVNTIDGSSIFISNWLNLFCLSRAEIHFLTTLPPGDHFTSRLTDPDLITFHTCDKGGVVEAISQLDAAHDFAFIFIRSWGPKSLWFSQAYAAKVAYYWPLTNEPTPEDRRVYDAVGRVVFQTAALRRATTQILGPKRSLIMQPIVDVSGTAGHVDIPREGAGHRLTFSYVGTLRAECYSRDLLEVMVATLAAHKDVHFHLVIGKIHYHDYAEKKAVLDLVGRLRELPNATVRERLDKHECDEILARSDVSFSLWERTPSNELQISTKLLESLSLGCHVITFDTDRHRRLLGADYPGLIESVSDLRSAVSGYLASGRGPRFSDRHMLSQFTIENQVLGFSAEVGVPLRDRRDCARRLFNKQYDEVYGVFIDENEASKLRALDARHGIRIRLFRGTLGREDLVEEYAEYQKRGLRTEWERAAKRQRLTIGAMGHLRTFIRIAEDALARGYRKILVLEADVILHRAFFERHAALAVEDYKLLYLGAGMWRSDVEYLSGRTLYRPNETTGTFAIAFDRSVLEECIGLWREFVDPTDVAIWEIQRKYSTECFVVSPNLAICDLCQSNTGHKRDQVKLSERFRWNLEDYDIASVEHLDRPVGRLRLHIAHAEPGARLRLVCAGGVRDVPLPRNGPLVELPVDAYVTRIEYENVFLYEVECEG